MGWQIAEDPVDRGLQTLERTGSLRTFDVVFKRRQVLQGSTVSANRQCCAARQPIRPRRPYVGQVLTERHRAAHLHWAQRHFRWGDSSGLGFYSLMSLGLTLVIMTVEFDNSLIERDRFGGGSVIVWGGIIGRVKTTLIVVQGNLKAQGFINQILQAETVPFLQRHEPAILMHGNARPHFARICRQLLNRNNANVLPWPAMSPDMNPIEHIWDYLGRKFRARGNVHKLRDLENALIPEWNNIHNAVIRRYVRSMRGCLTACINIRGGHTRY